MKKFRLFLLFSASILIIGVAFAFVEKSFDFIAPSVPDTSYAPDQIGLIVHQTDDATLRARTSAGWVRIDNDNTSSVPVGTILPYVGTTAPAGYVLCNGNEVSRTTYSDLYAVIGNKFGSGDGSTTFKLPDFRGKFIRGWNNSAGNDPDASSRSTCATGGNSGDAIGSCQSDQLKSHDHQFTVRGGDADGGSYVDGNAGQSPSGTFTTDSTGGTETRPVNVTVNYIIKI